jgi:hypothetical protein
MIEQIITKYNPPGQVKTAPTEVAEVARKAAKEEKVAGSQVSLNAVKSMHDRLKSDLLVVHNDLDAKINEMERNTNQQC